MAIQRAPVEIHLVVDEDGDYSVGHDNEIGNSDLAIRFFVLKLSVPLPYSIEVSGEITDKEGEHKLVIS